MQKKRPPHVLYIISKLELGGAQKVCLSLFHGLRREGEWASLISASEGELADSVRNHSSVFLFDELRREISGPFGELKAFWRLVATIGLLKKKYPNLVVHTHSTKAGLMGRWAALCAGVKKKVHTVHGFGFNDYQSWFVWWAIFVLEWLTCLITTHYICVSEHDMRQGAKRLPWFHCKSSLIRAAVDRVFFTPAKRLRTAKIFFGTVSCFKPQKNVFDLLKAFKMVLEQASDKKKIHLQLVGDGMQRKQIERWVAQHNLSCHVQLLGWQNEVKLSMKQWDVYVMSSLWEGLPCAVVEARLCTLPVVSYRVGGIPDIIYHGVNGYLVRPGNWQALASYMGKLAEDDVLRQRLAMHRENLSSFEEGVMVQKHIKLYQQISSAS